MDIALNRLASYLNSIMPISDTQIDQLSVFKNRRFQKHERFLTAGDVLTHIGFNIKGAFRYYYLDYEGKERTKYFVTGNDFILSFSSFIKRCPSIYSIEALEDSEILIASVCEVDSMLQESHYWQNIFHRVLEKTYIYKEQREAELLMYDAKTRYLRFISEYPDISERVKQHYIASYLGIQPQSLSRIKTQLLAR